MAIVTRVGDALQEPFWPEGLGINRGFLGALDCADLIAHAMPLILSPLGAPPSPIESYGGLMRRREELYGLTKRLSGSNRLTELRSHLDAQRRFGYTFDPATRYSGWTRASDVRFGLTTAAVPSSSSSRTATPHAGPPKMTYHVGFGKIST